MKPINKYVCLVDNYRRSSRQRNTVGRYIVCAKTEKEAKEILQKMIGFGSIQVYYQITKEHGLPSEIEANLSYKEAKKMEWEGENKWKLVDVKHSTDYQEEQDMEQEMEI